MTREIFFSFYHTSTYLSHQMVYKSGAVQKLKSVVDIVQAVKMVNARGEVKCPIKGINILKAHGKSARDSFLMNDYALNIGSVAQGISLKVAPAKVASCDDHEVDDHGTNLD